MGHHLVKNLPNLGGGGGGDFNDLHDNVVERKLLGLSLYCVVCSVLCVKDGFPVNWCNPCFFFNFTYDECMYTFIKRKHPIFTSSFKMNHKVFNYTFSN